jgi:predicted SAM-dependent methyltransferase
MDTNATAPILRLHLGCGPNILPGWINIDSVPTSPGIRGDIALTALPWPDASVDEILSEHVFEHLSFAEEKLAWHELARVLRLGGTATLEVPDFEWVCATFLAAQDQWRDFYRVGHPDHYAGCGTALDQRWGILQTMFFGNQNGAGQFHRSAYTEAKLRALAEHLGFAGIRIDRVLNKGGQALRAILTR